MHNIIIMKHTDRISHKWTTKDQNAAIMPNFQFTGSPVVKSSADCIQPALTVAVLGVEICQLTITVIYSEMHHFILY